jgi:hypothetical protein
MLHVHTIDLKTPGDRPEIVRTKYFSTLFKIIDTVQKKELIINETVQQYSLTHQMSIMLFVVKILSTIILFYCGKKRFYRKNCFGYICISQKKNINHSFIHILLRSLVWLYDLLWNMKTKKRLVSLFIWQVKVSMRRLLFAHDWCCLCSCSSVTYKREEMRKQHVG